MILREAGKIISSEWKKTKSRIDGTENWIAAFKRSLIELYLFKLSACITTITEQKMTSHRKTPNQDN